MKKEALPYTSQMLKVVEEQTKEFCCNNSEKHNIQWRRISSSFEEARLMKNLLRSSFVCFSNAEGGYGRNFATTMTNWQMLQHWQAEYTCNKEEEAAALKLAYDKEPLPYLCFWISKVTLKPRKKNLLILIHSLHSCKRIFLWCSWLERERASYLSFFFAASNRFIIIKARDERRSLWSAWKRANG